MWGATSEAALRGSGVAGGVGGGAAGCAGSSRAGAAAFGAAGGGVALAAAGAQAELISAAVGVGAGICGFGAVLWGAGCAGAGAQSCIDRGGRAGVGSAATAQAAALVAAVFATGRHRCCRRHWVAALPQLSGRREPELVQG